MAKFGSNDKPTPVERLRHAAFWVLALIFAAGVVFLVGGPDNDGPDFFTFAMFPVFAVIWLLSLRKVIGWLEWRRRVQPGEWRTTRASTLSGLVYVAMLLAFAAKLGVRTAQVWSIGDGPRSAAGLVVVTISIVLVGVIARSLRVTVELAIDEHGVRTAEWRGVAPWTAIAMVVSPKSQETTDELHLVLKSEALPNLPAAMRRRNGDVRIDLSKVNLSPEQALDAMRAAYPDLQVGGRSAGLVLPVRGATDIVEADL